MANKTTIIIVLFIMFPVVRMAKQRLKPEACPVTDAINKYKDEVKKEHEEVKKLIDEMVQVIELSCTPSCLAGWVRHGDACYYIDDTTPTTKWANARAKCQNMGADLPIIKSSAENTFILDLAQKQHTVTLEGVWLGMQRKDKTSKLDFYWIDGSPLKKQAYQNWKTGEPNMDLNHGGEHCGNMYVTSSKPAYGIPGKWNDINCECTAYPGGEAECPVVLCQKPL